MVTQWNKFLILQVMSKTQVILTLPISIRIMQEISPNILILLKLSNQKYSRIEIEKEKSTKFLIFPMTKDFLLTISTSVRMKILIILRNNSRKQWTTFTFTDR
ncbi:uncharacterized protein LOC111617995 [Centruroides sculpturatus]|uniref:uncharacterized protein LOC111617995 n=1 Tax=Centruroides sculpturatus TaxID=218467 RepID=UPI000C6C9417|nr:uncharacterized protein LOC111617995 [Centruroides sculpturatus]